MKKILIVDDMPEIRNLVKITLSSGNYQILEAESGEQAIKVTEKEMPNLIIMDVMMPGEIDGFKATKIIKQKLPNIKIVILTGKTNIKDQKKGLEYGADDYFVKPFSPLNLIEKVEEIFE